MMNTGELTMEKVTKIYQTFVWRLFAFVNVCLTGFVFYLAVADSNPVWTRIFGIPLGFLAFTFLVGVLLTGRRPRFN